MDKRIITLLYFIVLGIEAYLCYIWLLKPAGPVYLSMLQGTFTFDIMKETLSLAMFIVRTAVQALLFALLFIGTSKLYKHLYVSLPNNTDNSRRRDTDNE